MRELGLNFSVTGIDMTLKGRLRLLQRLEHAGLSRPPATKDYSLGYTTNIAPPLEALPSRGEATYHLTSWLRRWLIGIKSC